MAADAERLPVMGTTRRIRGRSGVLFITTLVLTCVVSLSGGQGIAQGATRTWQFEPAMPTARTHMAAAVMGQTLYVAGRR